MQTFPSLSSSYQAENGSNKLKEEQTLVQRAQNGDIAAFRELVERHKRQIYYLAFDLTGNHHDAEDLSQEVFIRVFRSIKKFRGDAQLSSWLYRITVNACLSKRRKKSLSAMQLQEDFDQDNVQTAGVPVYSAPDKSAETGLMQKHIETALQKLSPREKSVFVLRHYHDMPLKEIADILEIKIGTVKGMLFRAIQKLQKALAFYKEDFGWEASND